MKTDTEVVDGLCRLFSCTREELDDKIIAAKVADDCFCDKPEDRLYHHSDNTWWRRVARDGRKRLVLAEPPTVELKFS